MCSREIISSAKQSDLAYSFSVYLIYCFEEGIYNAICVKLLDEKKVVFYSSTLYLDSYFICKHQCQRETQYFLNYFPNRWS